MKLSKPSAPDHHTPATRILGLAMRCRARDLTQLSVLGDLTKNISELVHMLQKERGVSSIYLGSNGTRFVEALAATATDSQHYAAAVYRLLEHIDEKLDQTSAGARFYARVALALRALDTVAPVRQRISNLALAPHDAIERFTSIIAALLAVGFEAADVAADPDTSRALVALVNFSQGKEYAGQERAIAGAAFSRREFSANEIARLQALQRVQEHTFQFFAEFADASRVAQVEELNRIAERTGLGRMRRTAIENRGEHITDVTADAWYDVTTHRIDAMKDVEDGLAQELSALCSLKLAEAASNDTDSSASLQSPAMLLFANSGHHADDTDTGYGQGVSLFSLRSMLDVIKEQARRIDDINTQLRSARVELAERKITERAKGILMRSRRLTEDEAYTLIRQTAMKQNKRMADVAEAIISMADVLKG